MIGEWMQTANPWLVFPASVGAILLAAIAGQALGQRVRDRHAGEGAQHLAPLQGALVGLLSLMIGFTFSLSASRFDARKSAVLHEATAISTAGERATLLPPPHAVEAGRLLTAYLETRILLGGEGRRPAEQVQVIGRSHALLEALWKEAAAVFSQDAQSQPASLFVQSLNAVGDRGAERLAADRSRVPLAVFLMLYGLAVAAWGFTGYAGGRAGARNMVSNLVLALAFATVIALVADLDRPGSGLVIVSQQPLLDLRALAHPPSV